MGDAEMPAEHPAAISALEADDMVVLHRSPDRDCGRRRGRRRRRCALAEATERAMHRRNEARELIEADSILRDIATDDPRNQEEINCLRGTFINHIFYPTLDVRGLVVEIGSFDNLPSTKYCGFSPSAGNGWREPTRGDLKDWSCHAGPMVRILFPPAESQCVMTAVLVGFERHGGCRGSETGP